MWKKKKIKTERDRNENDQLGKIQVKFFQDVENIKYLFKHLQSHFSLPSKKAREPWAIRGFPRTSAVQADDQRTAFYTQFYFSPKQRQMNKTSQTMIYQIICIPWKIYVIN